MLALCVMWLLLSESNRYTGVITVFMGYVRCSWKYYGFPYRFLGFTTTSTLDIGFSLRYDGMIFAVRVSVLTWSKQLD